MFLQTAEKSTPLSSSMASMAAPEYLGPSRESWFAPRVRSKATIKRGHCCNTYLLNLKKTPFLLLGFMLLSVKEGTSHLRIAYFFVLGTARHQLLVFAATDDSAVLDNQNKVTVFNGANSLRHRDNRRVGNVL